MSAEDIILEVKEIAGEWLEMTENPDALVSGILANRIIKQKDYIEYLEKRLDYVCANK